LAFNSRFQAMARKKNGGRNVKSFQSLRLISRSLQRIYVGYLGSAVTDLETKTSHVFCSNKRLNLWNNCHVTVTWKRHVFLKPLLC